MNGGKISGNTASGSGGGGVYVATGTFTMNGGEISGNTATGSLPSSGGGGVYISSGTFTMHGGEISGNGANSGGGVYNSGTFTKDDGSVINNTPNNIAGDGAFDVPFAPLNTLAETLNLLRVSAKSNTAYTLDVTDDEELAPQALTFRQNNVTVTLKGIGGEKVLSLRSNGSLFSVGSAIGTTVTLVLDENITLKGRIGNTASLVRVDATGTLVMNDGAKISGNTNTSSNGGGVTVATNGTFTMHGGEISGNTAYSGGGVTVATNGTFTMHGGEISGNTAYATSFTGGGGVYMAGTFRISNGTIYGSDEDEGVKNTAGNGAALFRGDGVAQYGTFSGSTWSSNGSLATTDDTIRVENGQLVSD